MVIENRKVIRDFNLSGRQQLFVLILLALLLNINTLFNEYAMDDIVVMTDNSLVQKGIKGIPDILTKDYFYGIVKKNSELAGGRYRPVTLVTFALEHQFFGNDTMVGHLINILLFAILIILLFNLLRSLFKEQDASLAFISCVIFIVHPVHTEVLANVKSRDELITFIFLLISLFYLIKYDNKPQRSALVMGLSFFFLALMTKESAVTLITIVPLILYFFYNRTIRSSLKFFLPMCAILFVYLFIRFSVEGYGHSPSKDVLNFPFMYATPGEAFATKVFMLVRYLWLLLVPYPLSCDYGYADVPFIQLLSIKFILSLLLIVGMILFAIFTFQKRDLFSFCILFFLLTLFPFTNFIIDIGTFLAERLLFLPSLGFCIAAGAIYLKSRERLGKILWVPFIFILLFFSAMTIERNGDWKNNETLYLKDVITSPKSVRTNMYAAAQYLSKAERENNKALKDSFFNMAVHYDETVLSLYRHYPPVYVNLGKAYFGLNDFYRSAECWMMAYNSGDRDSELVKEMIGLSDIFLKEGNDFYVSGNIDAAIMRYKTAVGLNGDNAEAWYNLGGNYFLINDPKNGMEAWQNVAILDPKHQFNKDEFRRP